MRHFLLYFPLLLAGIVYPQKDPVHCTIIDMTREQGTFTIRDNESGRIQVFKPDALEGAELKVGDTVDVSYESGKIVSVKGTPRSYDLLNAGYGDSCCIIVKLDTAASESAYLVTAKNNTTGENFHFNVPKLLASKLNEGGIIFTQPSHGYAMIALGDSTEKYLFGFPMLADKPK